jgi:hypothetical protein
MPVAKGDTNHFMQKWQNVYFQINVKSEINEGF